MSVEEKDIRNPPCDFKNKLNFALRKVPLDALSENVISILCSALNGTTVSCSSSTKIPRNYRGLAELANLSCSDIRDVAQSEDPMRNLLHVWKTKGDGYTVGHLLEFLNKIDRFDVLEDTEPLLECCSHKFLEFLCEREKETDEGKVMKKKATEFGLDYNSRYDWGACEAKKQYMNIGPVSVVFIHHTVSYMKDAKRSVKNIQAYKFVYFDHNDVPYNFLISEDGQVFEGRGWDIVGSHTRRYNDRTISIALIGNYEKHVPTKEMLDATQQLIKFGVSIKKIKESHAIYAHNDASRTLSPGKYTIEAISNWPRFRAFGKLPQPEELISSVEKLENSDII